MWEWCHILIDPNPNFVVAHLAELCRHHSMIGRLNFLVGSRPALVRIPRPTRALERWGWWPDGESRQPGHAAFHRRANGHSSQAFCTNLWVSGSRVHSKIGNAAAVPFARQVRPKQFRLLLQTDKL